ncbi:MAG: cobalamin-dependent protein [Desulfobacterales bacterium]|nr:cobalamin-dependent protein [Desulfobacterales bacterium]
MPDTPHILAINPWIHDFAAHDYWARPYGLLMLTAILREHGFRVSYIDCLDRFHPKSSMPSPHKRYGRGQYLKTHIPKPKGLEDVPRKYSRYGIKKEWFLEDLASIPIPDVILVTSIMTYWAGGVRETIQILKEQFPHVPVILGGIYATLCFEHATQHSGADRIIKGQGDRIILQLIQQETGYAVQPQFDPDQLDTYPYPAYDLQRTITFIPILTSRGCPYACDYCASRYLVPKYQRHSPEYIYDEIMYWHNTYHITDFVFYDDALLIDAETYIIPLLEKIIRNNHSLRFHTPNAVHVRAITERLAKLMYQAGFESIHLGLESTTFSKDKRYDQKFVESEFQNALNALKSSGFHTDQIAAYLLAGLPDEDPYAIDDSINMLLSIGVTPLLANYTPIPHTALWERAKAVSRYPLETDPVFTNNSIFPCQKEPFSWENLARYKRLMRNPIYSCQMEATKQ